MKSVLLALPLIGCVAEQVTPLATLGNRHLQIGGGAGGVNAELEFDEVGSDRCAVLSGSFRALLNSQPVHVVMNDYIDADTWCLHPPLQLRIDDPERADHASLPENDWLTIFDDSLTISVPLGDLLTRRSATFTPDGTLHRGEQMTVTWSPASDLTGYQPRVLFRQGESVWIVEDVMISDNRLSLTVPSRGLAAGEAMFEIYMNDAHDELPCSNARCTLAAARHVVHPVIVD